MKKSDRMSASEYRAGGAGVPLEAEECKHLVTWAHSQVWNGYRLSELLVHVPNGAFHGVDRKSAAVVARKLREQGLQAGVFDYILPIPWIHLGIPGLWLEMKRTRGGEVSTDQVQFRVRMEALGWRCAIAKGWVEASTIIQTYLQLGHS